MPLRIGTTLLVGVTSLIGLGVGIIHSLFFDIQEANPAWILPKAAGSTVVVAVGCLTLYYLWSRGSLNRFQRQILWLGAIGFVPFGAYTILGTIQLAHQTADWEFYMIAAGAAMIVQGLLTLFSLSVNPTPFPL